MNVERDYTVFSPIIITLTSQSDLEALKLLLGESKHLALTGSAETLIEQLKSDLNCYH